jgi:hypothetical protein
MSDKYCCLQHELQGVVIYLDDMHPDGRLRQTKIKALRELQSATGEELSALLPSVLDRAFKGEL